MREAILQKKKNLGLLERRVLVNKLQYDSSAKNPHDPETSPSGLYVAVHEV